LFIYCGYERCRCDADPGTLARYVAALIKKDKSKDELRKICLKKLQIFLQTSKEKLLSLKPFLLHVKVYIFCPRLDAQSQIHK